MFDKTGTLTNGAPEVVSMILLVKEAVCSSHLLTAVLGLAESHSEHPLGEAISRFAVTVSVSCTYNPSECVTYSNIWVGRVVNYLLL